MDCCTVRRFTREPHDILKELRLLSDISHPNVFDIMSSFRDDEQLIQNIYIPFLPISLVQLLASSYFSSYPVLSDKPEGVYEFQEEQFIAITKSLMFQVLCAVAFLHDTPRKIATVISNALKGRMCKVDLGISFKNEPDTGKIHGLWLGPQNRLYFEVSTGPYLWNFVRNTDFFTLLRLCGGDDDDDEADINSEYDDASPTPFIVPNYTRIGNPSARWTRDSLFNGERGEIGLVWSIFKIFGTPTAESWPGFDEPPGSKSVVLKILPAVPLSPLLPNLPPSSVLRSATISTNNNASEKPKDSVLNLLQQFLLYSPGSRIRAEDALHHLRFTNEDSIPKNDRRRVAGQVFGGGCT